MALMVPFPPGWLPEDSSVSVAYEALWPPLAGYIVFCISASTLIACPLIVPPNGLAR
jgi:hypothetical protein